MSEITDLEAFQRAQAKRDEDRLKAAKDRRFGLPPPLRVAPEDQKLNIADTASSKRRSLINYDNTRYPLDVAKYAHLDFVAYQYKLSTVAQRNQSGLGGPTGGISRVGQPSSGSENQAGAEPKIITRFKKNPFTRPKNSPPPAKINIVDKAPKALFRTKLYIPGGFGEKFSTRWENESIAMIGSTSSLNSIWDMGWEIGRGITQQAIQRFIGRKRDSIFGRAAETLQATLGKRIAPLDTRTFKGSDGRSLPLEFNFAPENKNEGIAMIRIIDAFRKLTLPFIDSTKFGGMILFYEYPPLWDIRVISAPPEDGKGSIKAGTFFQYRDMALTNVDISYSDDTIEYTHFHDGIPSSAKLTLQFESIYPAIESNTRLKVDKDEIHDNFLVRTEL